MTLCTECKHYREGQYYPRRGDPDACVALAGQVNPVTGQAIGSIGPNLMRMTLCGWNDPKLFEPKPIEPTPKAEAR